MKSLMHLFAIVIASTFIVSVISQSVEADLVTDLPDFPYKGRMYSGYLNLEDPLKKYHYFFVEAQYDSPHAPLVLWLNGGPGCSSMLGLLQEHGPAIFPGTEETMVLNEYAWNKKANIIYLESPGNVGFSYIDSFLPTEVSVNDEIVAVENFQALQSFFRKFPSFKDNDFYIAGESYAGIYIPRLSDKILQYNSKVPSGTRINLKGMLIGNGVASWEYDTTPALYDFAFTHHVYSYELRKDFINYCVKEYNEEKCNEFNAKFEKLLDGLNIYDLLQDCGKREGNRKTDSSSFYYQYARWAFPKNMQTPNKKIDFTSALFGEEKTLRDDPPCVDAVAPTKYLNREDVKAALHVKSSIKWQMCSDSVYEQYERSKEASLYLYPSLINAGLRIMIFSGDTDMAVPFNGNQRWIDSLGLEVASPWRKWRAFNDRNHVAGYRTIYKGLTFVTIKGTGHMVPQWKPKEAYYMFEKYLANEDL